MPLSLNDIRDRALAFSREWAHAESEDAEAQSFWNDFFEVFGVSRRRVATFEKRVKKIDGKDGYIDLLWKRTLLIEHKSRGKDLERAYKQATEYFPGLKDSEIPHYVLVSDFSRFKLYDLDENKAYQFTLKELHKKIDLFSFISGYKKQVIREQDPVNVEAVQKMGDLHDLLKKDGYSGHQLEVFLVRLLFCLFADDTGIFQPKQIFLDLIESFTSEDGANLGDTLERLFLTLNTPVDQRQKALPEHFAKFPYVNGRLFEEHLDAPVFNRKMRELLLELRGLAWGAISPAIFGAMFQSVIELDAKKLRRQLGAHYTSETNILKLIRPLFLDELRVEFERAKRSRDKLFEFHKKLNRLTFLDPACGCGNFLVISYRELRRLEVEVLQASEEFGHRLGSLTQTLKVDVDQFYGIEIEEFPAQVAQVAMWLTDHQMNVEAGEVFGEQVLRIPLEKSANIRLGNALQIDWAEFVPPNRLNYILGNPPFVGAKFMEPAQRADMETVCAGINNYGLLDYVAGWYVKAARYLTATQGFSDVVAKAAGGRKRFQDVRFGKGEHAVADLFGDADDVEARARRAVKCAFVSTNSITQGEQVGVLWGWMLAQGIRIHFAHRTFQWMNEAPGKAAVHCVVIGFAAFEPEKKRLFDYADIKGEPHEVMVKNINPYLVDADDVLIDRREHPICPVPEIGIGNKPIDDGQYLFTSREKETFLKQEPRAKQLFRRWYGATEFLNNIERWFLLVANCPVSKLQDMALVLQRVEAVRKFRENSKSAPTRELAKTPTRFHVENIPESDYLIIPRHFSEDRSYMVFGFVPPTTLAGDACLVMRDATPMHFGVMVSSMHSAWVRYVCGRIKSDYRYSKEIVYNNFPWPSLVDEKKHADDKSKHLRGAIETAAQGVLDAREAEMKRDPEATLAVLYNPETMPPALVKAHQALDRAVDAAYIPDSGKRTWTNDAERVAFLFKLYQRYTSLPLDTRPAAKKPKRMKRN
ncbi:MAG: DNA methyltransferase [Burkholderiales bacterium]